MAQARFITTWCCLLGGSATVAGLSAARGRVLCAYDPRRRVRTLSCTFTSSAAGGSEKATKQVVPLERQEHVAALAFDLETTGLDTRTNEIVQFAVVVANSQKGLKYQSLVLPEGEIDPGASAVHGLTREMLLASNARPFAEVWKECEDWLEHHLGSDRPLVWAAHNGRGFDVPILTRCVSDSNGPLSSPRASFVDTLPMARVALPGRRRGADGLGPHTLGSLFRSATGGATLEGAHDALADAEALAVVWRWLVEEAGADKPSTAWAAARGGSTRRSPFQDHLQYHGYRMQEVLGGAEDEAKPSRARTNGPAAREARSKTSKGPASPPASDEELQSLMTVPGVGAYLAKRLYGQGIRTYEDLERAWRKIGSRAARSGQASHAHRRTIGWLRASIPGANVMVLARAAKGMQSEWGAAEATPREK